MASESSTLDIEVDEQKCVGHGRCLMAAPEVFDYDDETNYANVIPGADLSAHAEAVQEAIQGCPEAAIVVRS